MKIIIILAYISLTLSEDLQIVLQELDQVTITEEAESTPLLQFTHSDFDDQPTRILNNKKELTYFTLTVEGKSYMFSTKKTLEEITETIDQTDSSNPS